MTTSFLKLFISAMFCIVWISGCTGSSDSSDEDYPESYLQFYNGSSNSPSIQIHVDGGWVGTSVYGDATSLFSLDTGETNVALYWEDADGQDTLIEETSLSLKSGQKTLLFIAGDFDTPDIASLQFDRSSLEDEFYLYTGSLVPDVSYDLYIAEEGASFSQANFIRSLAYIDFDKASYWDSSDDEYAYPEEEYVIYLTEAGTDNVVFESQSIDFAYATDYTLVVRQTMGANDANLVVDLILNSTNITANQDIDATSQVRIYSALSSEQVLSVELDGSDEVPLSMEVTGGSVSEYATLPFGDYQVTASLMDDTQLAFDNRLLTLNQGSSKTLVVFLDAEQQLTSIEMSDSVLPQNFEHEINVANLLSEFNDVDVYFVRDDETKETAQYKMTGLDYAESRSISLPNDYYSIIAIYEDALGIESLLYRSEIIDFTQDDLLMLTIEANTDLGGYKVKVIQ